MSDIRCSVLKSDYILTAPKVGTNPSGLRVAGLIAGSVYPQTDLAVIDTPIGSVDISGQMFIRNSRSMMPYSLAVNRSGQMAQILITNVDTLNVPASYTWGSAGARGANDFPSRGHFYMAGDSVGSMNVSVIGVTDITPYLSLGNSTNPVRVECVNSGDSNTGALIVNGGICAKAHSNFSKCTIEYGTSVSDEFVLAIRNSGCGTVAAGLYPFWQISNNETAFAYNNATVPHVNFFWQEGSSGGLSMLTYNGLANNEIVLGCNVGTNSSTDTAAVNHYNTRVYLPNPNGYTNSHTDCGLDINGGMYVGRDSFFSAGFITPSIMFGTSGVPLTSYATCTLGSSWLLSSNTTTSVMAQPISYQKLGRVISIMPTDNMTTTFTLDSAVDTIVYSGTLPSTALPAEDISTFISILSNSTAGHALVTISTTGSIVVSGFDATHPTSLLATPIIYYGAS